MGSAHERQLLIDAHHGDDDAAVRLYRLMAPRMLAYARGLLNHDTAAEDAVQQVFLRIFTLGSDEVVRVDDVLAWLIRLTRNTALNDARTHQRARDRARAWRPFAMTLLHNQAHDELIEAIGGLGEDARELILLKHIAGLTFDQMAASLGDNRNTIASRYRAAMEQLRSHITRPERAEEVPHG